MSGMEPKKTSPSESLIQSLEMFSQLSVREFVDLQMPDIDPTDSLDVVVRNSTRRAITRLVEILACKGELELVPNQNIAETNPLDLLYQKNSLIEE
jgi:hypothetical protein